MKAGSITRTHVILLLVLVVGAGSYMYFKQVLPKHTATRDQARVAQETAAANVANWRSRAEQVTNEKIDLTALPKILISDLAVPRDENVATAMLEVQEVARKAGFTISSIASEGGAGEDPMAGAEAVTGPTATVLKVEGHASFSNVTFFVDRLQRLVEQRGSKVYVQGRLYNVTGITVGAAEDTGGGSDDGGFDDGLSEAADANAVPAGHLNVSLTIEMFALNSDGSGSADVGTAEGAAATDPATGAAPGTDAGGTGTGAPGADAAAGTPGAGAPAGDPAAGAPAGGETATAGAPVTSEDPGA